jgi:hypothetical protein
MIQYVHHPTRKIIQECNDKMPKRKTSSKCDETVSFITLYILKYEFMKPQMIRMAENELAGVWKEVALA